MITHIPSLMVVDSRRNSLKVSCVMVQRDRCRHEVTEDHREAEIAQINWKRGVMVDNLIERNRKDVIQENRKVMICVLDCVRYLSEKNDGISWKDSQ